MTSGRSRTPSPVGVVRSVTGMTRRRKSGGGFREYKIEGGKTTLMSGLRMFSRCMKKEVTCYYYASFSYNAYYVVFFKKKYIHHCNSSVKRFKCHLAAIIYQITSKISRFKIKPRRHTLSSVKKISTSFFTGN